MPYRRRPLERSLDCNREPSQARISVWTIGTEAIREQSVYGDDWWVFVEHVLHAKREDSVPKRAVLRCISDIKVVISLGGNCLSALPTDARGILRCKRRVGLSDRVAIEILSIPAERPIVEFPRQCKVGPP